MALDFAAGCLGGCAGLMVGYPLDTIKVHLQTQDHRNPKFKGTWHCFRTIFVRESMAGLYRGMTSPISGVAVVNAIIFGAYGHAQRNLPDPNHLSSHFLAGAMAGLAQAPVCSPLELAKMRLQLQSTREGRFRGPIDCLRHIYRQQGHRGVFNGLGITAIREAPSFGVYFTTYEALTRSSTPSEISTIHMLLAGGLAGTASWTTTYPIDVIKTRLQADGTGRYNGAIDCLRQSIRADGYKWLFRGLNSTILRAFPTNAATFAVVTWTFRTFGEQRLDVPQSFGSREMKIIGKNDNEMDYKGRSQARESQESFVDKCNSLVAKVMDEYNYESRTYCSLSLSLIAQDAAMRMIEHSGNGDSKQRCVDAEYRTFGSDEAEPTLSSERMEDVGHQHGRADEGG